ncbi:MAG: fused MFS/spermidine synthase [Chloroflexi bacterium]|nr:fused MFS/spermidine synthase [Chloroflexota bacterium]
MKNGRKVFASLEPYLIVFLASAAGLVIEIVAARILAPVIGVSLYTWTSIIGIVLAGISLGNFLGGQAADRLASRTLLGIVLGAAAVTSVIVLPLARVVPDWLADLPLIPRIVLMTTILFFVPSTILAMVSPIVIKLQLSDLSKTGKVVGRLYAVSTFGAIFGVFITGFVLIQTLGSRSTIALVAIGLTVMALVFGRLWRPRLAAGAGVAIAITAGGLGGYGVYSGGLTSPCIRESNYYCIKITGAGDDKPQVKALVLDQLVHSYVSLEDPKELSQYGYEVIFSEVAEHLADRTPEFRSLFIGGGGYVLPRYFEVVYPGSAIEVIEIDPAVTEVVHSDLGLWRDTRIKSLHEDARMRVPRLPKGSYDLIVGDAFNDVSVPYHLTTYEFNEQIKALLKPHGIYTINIVDRPHSGRFLRSFAHTLQKSFPHVTLVSPDGNFGGDPRTTTVVIASFDPITQENLREASLRLGRPIASSHVYPPVEMEILMNESRAVLITDDYAPVDQMLAPLYLESR